MKKKILYMIIIPIIISALGFGGYTVYQITHPSSLFDGKNDGKVMDEQTKEPEPKQDEVDVFEPQQPEPEEEQYKFAEDRVNVLVLGIDSSLDRQGKMTSFRSDTIILLSIDFSTKKVYMISIPRDSYVDIYKKPERNKINAAFSFGGGAKKDGFLYSMKTVSAFLGNIPINYYVGFDMNVVKEIINAMGGIDYEVDVPLKIAGRALEPGYQHLNGQQVLDYARWRYTRRGDIDRVERQQKLLFSIFDQMKRAEQIKNIPAIYKSVQNNIFTNLDFKQIAALAYFAKDLEMTDLKRYSAPGDFLNIDGISYWGILQDKKRDMIKEVFGINIKIDPRDDVKFIKKEIEETRKAIAKAVNGGNMVAESAKNALEQYKAYLSRKEIDDFTKTLNYAESAIDSEILEEINRYVPMLSSAITNITAAGKERKTAIDAAQIEINKAQAKLKEYGEWMTAEEKNGVQGKINDLKAVIEKKLVEDIKKTVQDMNAYAQPLFDQYAKLANAVDEGKRAITNARKVMENQYATQEDKDALQEGINKINKAIEQRNVQEISGAARQLNDMAAQVTERTASKKAQQEALAKAKAKAEKLLKDAGSWTEEQKKLLKPFMDALSDAVKTDNAQEITNKSDTLYQEMKKINPEYQIS